MKNSDHKNSKIFIAGLIALDALLLHLFTLLTFYIRYFGNIYEGNLNAYLSVFVPFILIIIVVAHFNDLYRLEKNISYIDIIYRSFKTVTFGYFIVVTYIFYSRAFAFPRTVILISWFLNIGAISFWRIIFKLVSSASTPPIKTLILGTSEDAKMIGREFKRYSSKLYKIEKYFSCNKDEKIGDLIRKVEGFVKNKDIGLIIISTDILTREEITKIFLKFNNSNVKIGIHPSLYEILIGNIELKQIAGIPLLDIKIGERYHWYGVIKKISDLIISVVAILLFLPLLLLCGLAVKLDSKGPFFYFQERCGKDGKIFKIIKFRTMFVDAEEKSGPTLAVERDSRVTRVGNFLRRTHLDEIPQFFNVLMGTMSIVGPRPERPFFVKQYEKKYEAYSIRMAVKPGITGLAQVHGRYDTTIENKLRYDLVYINNMSPLLDLKILILTLKSIVTFKDRI